MNTTLKRGKEGTGGEAFSVEIRQKREEETERNEREEGKKERKLYLFPQGQKEEEEEGKEGGKLDRAYSHCGIRAGTVQLLWLPERKIFYSIR